MSIGQVTNDGGLQPLNEKLILKQNAQAQKDAETVEQQKSGDTLELSDEAKKYQNAARLSKTMDSIPEPNAGRLAELKSSIANGTLMNDGVLADTAGLIADRLL